MIAGIGSASVSSAPANRTSVAASARLLAASTERRSARVTSVLTTMATATNTTSAMTLTDSATVHVCSGGVKNQLAISAAVTAPASAGQNPPTAAMATTARR